MKTDKQKIYSWNDNFKCPATFTHISYLIYKEKSLENSEIGLKCLSISYLWANSLGFSELQFYTDNFINYKSKKETILPKICQFYLETFEKDDRKHIQFHKKVIQLILQGKGTDTPIKTTNELIDELKSLEKENLDFEICVPFSKDMIQIETNGKKEKLKVYLTIKNVKMEFIIWNLYKDIPDLIGFLYSLKTKLFMEKFDLTILQIIAKKPNFIKNYCSQGLEYPTSVDNLYYILEDYTERRDFFNGFLTGLKMIDLIPFDHPEYHLFYYDYLFCLAGAKNLLHDPKLITLFLPDISEDEKKLIDKKIVDPKILRKFITKYKKLYEEQLQREKNNLFNDPEWVYEYTYKGQCEKFLTETLFYASLNMGVTQPPGVEKIEKEIIKKNQQMMQDALKELAEVCTNCKKSENEVKLKKCSRCQKVKYCGVECQKAHWNIHKFQCGK